MARRFGGHRDLAYYMCQEGEFETRSLHVLNEPMPDEVTHEAEPYPFGFDPTFCRYRLQMPSKMKRPGNIFVCSMGDLFGPWVPSEWIDDVMKAAGETKRHNYCFLTKFPRRYNELPTPPENFFFGASIDTQQRLLDTLAANVPSLRYLSIEPIFERIDLALYIKEAVRKPEWVIVGHETGVSPGRVKPKKEWLDEILEVCSANHIPLYIKKGEKLKSPKRNTPSYFLENLMGDRFIQQYPEILSSKITDAPERPEAPEALR